MPPKPLPPFRAAARAAAAGRCCAAVHGLVVAARARQAGRGRCILGSTSSLPGAFVAGNRPRRPSSLRPALPSAPNPGCEPGGNRRRAPHAGHLDAVNHRQAPSSRFVGAHTLMQRQPRQRLRPRGTAGTGRRTPAIHAGARSTAGVYRLQPPPPGPCHELLALRRHLPRQLQRRLPLPSRLSLAGGDAWALVPAQLDSNSTRAPPCWRRNVSVAGHASAAPSASYAASHRASLGSQYAASSRPHTTATLWRTDRHKALNSPPTGKRRRHSAPRTHSEDLRCRHHDRVSNPPCKSDLAPPTSPPHRPACPSPPRAADAGPGSRTHLPRYSIGKHRPSLAPLAPPSIDRCFGRARPV